MNIAMQVHWEIKADRDGETKEHEEIAEEIIRKGVSEFAQSVRSQMIEQGVTDVRMVVGD